MSEIRKHIYKKSNCQVTNEPITSHYLHIDEKEKIVADAHYYSYPYKSKNVRVLLKGNTIG